MKVLLGGRAAEQIVFGAVTNGAANDLERVTDARPRDGLRVRHGRRGRVAHDARRQLRALRADEAAARPRAGAAHRPRLRRGGPAPRQAPRDARPRRGRAAREGDAQPRRSSRSCSAGCCPSRTPPIASARPAPSRPPTDCGPAARIGRVDVRSVHHVAFAVEDLDEAVETYRSLFGAEVELRGRLERSGRRGGVSASRQRAGRARRSARRGHARRALPRAAAARACTTSASPSADVRAAVGRARRATARRSSTPSRVPGSAATWSRSSIPSRCTAFSRR